MKIRRSRKGAYDKRMRRSTRNASTLILDLVTLTPAALPLPAYYARLRTLTRSVPSLRLASTRPDSPRLASDRFVSRSYSRAYVAFRVALGILSNASSLEPCDARVCALSSRGRDAGQ